MGNETEEIKDARELQVENIEAGIEAGALIKLIKDS